jgi:hypothetical protein
MIKEEFDKITLDAVQAVLEEVGFDVRRMETPCIKIGDYQLMALTRSIKCGVDAQDTLRLFKESMKQSFWDFGVGRIYLYQVRHHMMPNDDYKPCVRYALHFNIGTRPGFVAT